ncbi:MAG: chemotaxis response regulator protein-glutamate methylesterase [Actinomycetota bacterium]|nr:chemotaxis response regulator protein-glutamate methylesterase [Actinomycetota bacterium]
MSKIKTLIVDDSTFMRKVLTDMIESDPDIEVIGVASNGLEAIDKVKELKPDVVTLDIEMPKMDGLTALEILMKENPIPVIMVSTLTQEGSDATAKALLLGALDFVAKPTNMPHLNMSVIKNDLMEKIKTAAGSKVDKLDKRIGIKSDKLKGIDTKALKKNKVVLIGASTGGPNALSRVISDLPADLPAPVVVVQHMPDGPFTKSFAERIDMISAIKVKEAERSDFLRAGQVLVAPGGYHMLIEKGGQVKMNKSPLVNGVRPAVDVMMNSAAAVYGKNIIGVILTGMGSDGAQGMAQIKAKGGRTVAQDEASCVVYGMPKSVVEMGNADKVVPLNDVASEIINMLKE